MKEDLNTVRINGLKQQRFRAVDERIIILERAMDNVNRGQVESTLLRRFFRVPTASVER